MTYHGMSRRWDEPSDMLDAEHATCLVNEAMRAAYGETVAILSDNAFISGILTEEVQFPDFMLPNSVGQMISLSGLPARRPVIVQFFAVLSWRMVPLLPADA
jgi:hypothetical protein